MIFLRVASMPTTVQVSEKTLQMLNELKKEMKARSHDEVIKSLISKRKRIPDSMFGSNRRLKPFSRADEGESHEL
jgi:predicted CopG family antitoxin